MILSHDSSEPLEKSLPFEDHEDLLVLQTNSGYQWWGEIQGWGSGRCKLLSVR